MSARLGFGSVAIALCWVALLAGIGLAGWVMLRPSPTFEDAAALAAAGRFDEAEERINASIKARGSDPRAHLLAAQLLLDRPVPEGKEGAELRLDRANRAADHLRQVQFEEPALAAIAALYRGKASYYRQRTGEAEAAWLDAIRLDPTVPEAGWSLLDLYYLQGREADGQRLALQLHEVEPDPHDRVQLLLELVRQDVMPLAPGAVVERFEPVVEQAPDDLHAVIALGLALVRDSRAQEGLALLRAEVQRRPEDVDAWDALLTGLDDAGELDLMAETIALLPSVLAESPRFARHRGRVAQERGDWNGAALFYRHAVEEAPEDLRLIYRLSRALRLSGDHAEADQLAAMLESAEQSKSEVPSLYDEANRLANLGDPQHAELFRRIAHQRERSGRLREALAWYRLVIEARPEDSESRSAAARLASSGGVR
ncbi:tetratricopeptide repeat protein [Tautonia rosea]|uniref:tetratricopeptide repeat protein n=1 Tax=Tautonia rosea TaxID=2728037 RepID=UPI0014736C4B|nr:hypothetical protein [Tautonia rosea]